MIPRKAVVCLSGGADSTTLLHLASRECQEVHALFLDYGQKHIKEKDSAIVQAKALNVAAFKVIQFDLTQFGGSPLTDSSIPTPTQRENKQADTVVPFRNTMILTFAAAYAKMQGCNTLYLGATFEDLKNYPDCRPMFFKKLQETLMLGDTMHDLHVRTPFVMMKKDEIIRLGVSYGIDYTGTWTCYEGGEYPCLKCDACRERMLSFRLNKQQDPLVADTDWADYLKEKI